MSDWITPVVGLIGVALGVSISEFRRWREGKEQYRIMTFEKRLDAHQRAYYWCNQLLEVINVEDKEIMLKTARDAHEWWNGSCLFLDSKSRKSFLSLTDYVTFYARQDVKYLDVLNILEDASKDVITGIGEKYLPEMTMSAKQKQNTSST